MRRLVIQTRNFSKKLDELIERKKIQQEDFEEFERRLVEGKEEGDAIQGTGGLRKIRLKSISKGKSGGFRICYLDVPEKEKLFLIHLYGKNEQEDLSGEEKKILRNLVEYLKRE